MKIYFVTTNDEKFEHLNAILPWKINHLKTEIEEIQGTIEEIAAKKSLSAFNLVEDGSLAIADDAGLEIKGLNNFPGPYLKHFLKIGYDSVEKIVKEVGRDAVEVSCLGLTYRDKNGEIKTHVVKGEMPGKLIHNPKLAGNIGLSFNDIFIPDGYDKTLIEMRLEERISCISRRKAAEALIEIIKNLDFILP